MYKLIIPMIVGLVVFSIFMSMFIDETIVGFAVSLFLGTGAAVLTMAGLNDKK